MKIIKIEDEEYIVLDSYDCNTLVKFWILLIILFTSLGIIIGWKFF